jgi:hypothetical protein
LALAPTRVAFLPEVGTERQRPPEPAITA